MNDRYIQESNLIAKELTLIDVVHSALLKRSPGRRSRRRCRAEAAESLQFLDFFFRAFPPPQAATTATVDLSMETEST